MGSTETASGIHRDRQWDPQRPPVGSTETASGIHRDRQWDPQRHQWDPQTQPVGSTETPVGSTETPVGSTDTASGIHRDRHWGPQRPLLGSTETATGIHRDRNNLTIIMRKHYWQGWSEDDTVKHNLFRPHQPRSIGSTHYRLSTGTSLSLSLSPVSYTHLTLPTMAVV